MEIAEILIQIIKLYILNDSTNNPGIEYSVITQLTTKYNAISKTAIVSKLDIPQSNLFFYFINPYKTITVTDNYISIAPKYSRQIKVTSLCGELDYLNLYKFGLDKNIEGIKGQFNCYLILNDAPSID